VTFGTDVNYKVKKLEARIRAAEDEKNMWAARCESLVEMYEAKVAALQLEVTRLRETGIRLPKGRAPKPKPEVASKPRGRKRVIK
jgi:hypothetical protein